MELKSTIVNFFKIILQYNNGFSDKDTKIKFLQKKLKYVIF